MVRFLTEPGPYVARRAVQRTVKRTEPGDFGCIKRAVATHYQIELNATIGVPRCTKGVRKAIGTSP